MSGPWQFCLFRRDKTSKEKVLHFATSWLIRIRQEYFRKRSFMSKLLLCIFILPTSCHRIVSDGNTVRWFINFSLRQLLGAGRNPHRHKRFQWSNVLVDFFEFLSAEFAACLKPLSRDNYCKVSYPKTQQRRPGCKLNPDHAIRVVAKTVLSRIQFNLIQ